MLSRVLRTIDEQGLVAAGNHVLVAVSGGPDSTALLHALVHLAPRLALTLQAACVDHGLRAESADEAAGVAARVTALGVPCAVLRVDVRGAKGRHVSWQEAARAQRLQALETFAREEGCDAVALGHTADDQAETVLFRIIRGTGVAGLGGIPYRRGVFARPLLDASRRSVLAFLERRRIPYVEDPSNQDRRFARSRLRHDLLPMLARENPRIREALVRLAAEARRGGARPQPIGGHVLAPRAVAMIDQLARGGAGTKRLSVAGGEIEIRYGQPAFRSAGLEDAPAVPPLVEISGPGRFPWPLLPEAYVAVTEADGPDAQAGLFDRDALSWPLRLRVVQPGDRMRPRGGVGRRKLQDLFVDAKIPRSLRPVLPLVVDAEGHILLVPGARPAERARPTSGTRRLVRIETHLGPTWLSDLCLGVR